MASLDTAFENRFPDVSAGFGRAASAGGLSAQSLSQTMQLAAAMGVTPGVVDAGSFANNVGGNLQAAGNGLLETVAGLSGDAIGYGVLTQAATKDDASFEDYGRMLIKSSLGHLLGGGNILSLLFGAKAAVGGASMAAGLSLASAGKGIAAPASAMKMAPTVRSIQRMGLPGGFN